METILYFQEKIKNEGDGIKAAILPLLKLITLTLFGFFLSKTHFVPKQTLKVLSKLVFVLFLPCLIFTQLGPPISLHNILQWWFIPVNVLVSTIIGCILGYFVALICRPPQEFFRFTIIMTGFGNTGNIPLAVVTSVCEGKDNPFGKECYTNGIAYVSFAQWVAVILVYTFVYHMMEPPIEYYEIIEEGKEIDEIEEEIEVSNNISRPILVLAEFPGLEDQENEHSKTPFIAKLFKSMSNVSNVGDYDRLDESSSSGVWEDDEENGKNSPKSRTCLAEPKMVRKIRVVAEQTPIYQVLQPPTIASFLAIIIGIIPGVKDIVYGADAPLEFITDSLSILSEAMVPSVMLVLGAMLAEGPNHSNLGVKTTIGIIFARFLILPVIGIGVIYLVDRWNLLMPGDLMYRFVLLLQYTTPSAILLGAVASLRGYAVKEASALLFWQHACAVFSFSGFIILYFHLVLSYV